MTRPRKVCVVVTARPSYSRVKTAMQAIQDHSELELQVVVAASALLDRYGRVASEIERDGFELNAEVYTVLEGESPISMAKTTGLGISELATVFDGLRPDVVVTVADRFETLATAVTAAYMNIPLVHIQGGEVTGSIDEKVRHAITKLADLHLVANEAAGVRVEKMGELPDKVKVTGCPSIDLIAEMGVDPELDYDPFERYTGVGARFPLDSGYIIVMQHPVTTEHRQARAHVEETLAAITEIGLPTFWFWPNIDAGADGTSKGIRAYREENTSAPIHFFKSLAPADFIRLLNNSLCLVGNSSAGIRESSYLGVPVVDIGNRQSGRDRGENVVHVNPDRDEIVAAIRRQLSHGRYPPDFIYGDGSAGPKIAEEIAQMPLTVEKRLAY